jgi:hypothetical protein
MAARTRPDVDPGLQQIANFEEWFLTAQLDVLAAYPLEPAAARQAKADAERLVHAIAERMRAEYAARQEAR